MVALPSRSDMPEVLRQLFDEARRARLSVDTARYEVSGAKSGGLVRYQIAFPIVGPYPQIRAFLDSTLASMPAVAVTDLLLERKSVSNAEVEAQVRMTAHAAGPGTTELSGGGAAIALTGHATSDRVVARAYAAALFAPHSWYVRPPPPPPPPPLVEPPLPEPSAPALPYTFVGSFAPGGDAPVFFLSRGDRMIDARVGDRLDGVYQLESATGGQLVFVYLPLHIRQTLAIGATK